MKSSSDDLSQLAADIVGWEDVSNWAFVPKTLLKHLFGLEGQATELYHAILRVRQSLEQEYGSEEQFPPPFRDLVAVADRYTEELKLRGVEVKYFSEQFERLNESAYRQLAQTCKDTLNKSESENKSPVETRT